MHTSSFADRVRQSIPRIDLEAIRHCYLRRVVGTAAGVAGLTITSKIAEAAARGVFGLNTFARRRAQERIRSALGPIDEREVHTIVSSMYGHFGRFWVEALFARRLLRESSWREFVDVRNEAALRRMATESRGCVLATAYYGNVAIAAWVLGRILRPVHVVVDAPSQPMLRRWQRDLYDDPFVRPINWRDAGRVIPGVLDQGGAVLMVCDHERPRGRCVPVDFLGCRLKAYPTLGRLAHWFDAPVGVVTCRREDTPFRFTFELHGVVRAASGRDESAVVTDVFQMLERAILARPDQYLWSIPEGAITSLQPAHVRTPEAHSHRESARPPLGALLQTA